MLGKQPSERERVLGWMVCLGIACSPGPLPGLPSSIAMRSTHLCFSGWTRCIPCPAVSSTDPIDAREYFRQSIPTVGLAWTQLYDQRVTEDWPSYISIKVDRHLLYPSVSFQKLAVAVTIGLLLLVLLVLS